MMRSLRLLCIPPLSTWRASSTPASLAIDLATRKGRLIAEHQHIEGIAIFCARARKEAEVKGKDHALGHDLGELETTALFIQLIFVAATARCLYDYRDNTFVLSAGRINSGSLLLPISSCKPRCRLNDGIVYLASLACGTAREIARPHFVGRSHSLLEPVVHRFCNLLERCSVILLIKHRPWAICSSSHQSCQSPIWSLTLPRALSQAVSGGPIGGRAWALSHLQDVAQLLRLFAKFMNIALIQPRPLTKASGEIGGNTNGYRGRGLHCSVTFCLRIRCALAGRIA